MEGTGELDTVDVRMLCQLMRKVDVAEIYSPERVAKVAKRMGLVGGLSMDLKTGWDFNIRAHRSGARENIKKDKPHIVDREPKCAQCSAGRKT